MAGIKTDEPVPATFRVRHKGKLYDFHCVLDGFNMEMEFITEDLSELLPDELLDRPMICFRDRAEMVIREAKLIPDETGKHGRFKSVEE